MNTLSQFISTMKQSIQDGYLRGDWHDYEKEDIVETVDGLYALKENCVKIEDTWYHTDLDSDYICLDDINDEHILMEESVTCYGRRGREIVTHKDYDELVFFRGEYYLEDYLGDNDLCRLHSGEIYRVDDACWVPDVCEWYDSDDCHYWECDGEYHLEEEPGEDDEDDEEETSRRQRQDSLWGYSQGPTEKAYVHEDAVEGMPHQFGFGMEIEKGEMPDFEFDKQEIYDTTGAVMERDGSVSNGFELKTPVYNLFSPKTEERLALLKDFANVDNVSNAGGHIGFSMEGKRDEELLDMCSGWVPLIYSMYKKRLDNHYCSGKTIAKLKGDKEKFQSINLRGKYIEFRVIASVKTYNTVLFRLKFFRLMASNLNRNFASVIGMAINPSSDLYKLLRQDVYKDDKKFERLIRDAISINTQFGNKKLTQKQINKITIKLTELQLCA